MIENVETVFPNNAVLLVQERLDSLDPDIVVLRRPLLPTDPVQAISVYSTLWTPNEDSYEILGSSVPRAHEPTLQNYNIAIQGLVKDMDQERGLAVHSVMAKMIRGMLYHDAPLRIGFGLLSAQAYGVTEKFKRWGIRSQRYHANEVEGDWLFLSVLDLWIETETV
jgi:hypothetical protein